MNITYEQEQNDNDPNIVELTRENITDIEKILNKYGVIPVKYYHALVKAAKKGLDNDS